jgi:hypothetical protein
MKYFQIRQSIEKKDIGHYPQSRGGSVPIFSVPMEILTQVRFDRKIPDEVNLSPLVVHNRGKITDFLGSYELGFGLILNERVKSLLENYNLPPLKMFYDINVYHKNELISGYYLFQPFINLYDWVDISNSRAELRKSISNEVLTEISLESEDSFKALKQSLLYQHEKKYETTSIILKQDFNFDIFVDNISNTGIIISERLYAAMIEAKISGIVYKAYPIIVKRE